MHTEHFTLTQDHIILLANSYVDWSECEYGAACIDPKRPYGNCSVERDVCELLGWGADPDELTAEQRRKAAAIHKETQTALAVILDTQSFVPGLYKRLRYGGKWERTDSYTA